jgi:hypothetical protein
MTSDREKIKVEVGYQSVIIDKLFGPMIFANLRITADPKTNTWLIERETIFQTAGGGSHHEWIEWVRIPGQLEREFKEVE